MDFGLFFLMQRDDQWSEQAVYDSALEQMMAAESLGYHSVWIAEHHFNDYGLCPAPQVLNSFDRTLLRLRPFEEYLATGWTLIGSPDEVRDGLRQYLEATGYQRVMLLMALPGLDTGSALRSMRLFVDEVMPAMTPVASAQGR